MPGSKESQCVLMGHSGEEGRPSPGCGRVGATTTQLTVGGEGVSVAAVRIIAFAVTPFTAGRRMGGKLSCTNFFNYKLVSLNT